MTVCDFQNIVRGTAIIFGKADQSPQGQIPRAFLVAPVNFALDAQ